MLLDFKIKKNLKIFLFYKKKKFKESFKWICFSLNEAGKLLIAGRSSPKWMLYPLSIDFL